MAPPWPGCPCFITSSPSSSPSLGTSSPPPTSHSPPPPYRQFYFLLPLFLSFLPCFQKLGGEGWVWGG